MTTRTCAIEGCTGSHHARGMCKRHWKQWRNTVEVPVPVGQPGRAEAERFWEKVAKSEGCWQWTGATNSKGYGQFRTAGGRMRPAHRWSYESFSGPIQEGLHLDHLCHTNDSACIGGASCPHRRCVNPQHLEPVTAKVNNHRSRNPTSTGELGTYCVNQHMFTAENVYVRPDGRKECRSCRHEKQSIRTQNRRG